MYNNTAESCCTATANRSSTGKHRPDHMGVAQFGKTPVSGTTLAIFLSGYLFNGGFAGTDNNMVEQLIILS